MKLLNVIDEISPLLGGASERTYQMSRYLSLSGVQVDLLTTKSRLDKAWVSKLSGIKVHILSAIYFRYLFPIGARRWLKKHISEYDVIHISKNWSLLANFTAAAAIRSGIPYVFSGMGFISIHNRSIFLKKIYKKYLSIPMILGAAACIAVTHQERDDLISIGVDPRKIHLIPNGIIVDDFKHKDDLHFRKIYSIGDRKIILFLGRMDPIKGVHLLIEAFGKLRNELAEWCLVLIGTQTEYRHQMVELVADLNLNQHILFLEPVFGDAKSEAYHAAEFIVVSSIKDAMTIVAPEAACCMRPVLITNTSDFSDLARFGGALEVNPTVVDLMRGLKLMASSKKDRESMGRKGFEYVSGQLKWESQATKYMDLFNSILSSNQSNAV